MRKILPEKAILIPDNAEKAYEGAIFDVYTWQQKLFDGSAAKFEMLKRPDTILVIAIKDGKFVVVEDEQPNRKPLTGLPGGRADSGVDVSWEDAAKRELREETGMTFNSWRLVKVIQPVRKIEWFVAVYLALEFVSKEEQVLDAGEKIEVLELEFEEFKEILIQENSDVAHAIESLEDVISLPEYVGIDAERS